MPERLTKCPLCKSGQFLNHKELTDYAVSKQSFLLSKCTNCQLLFTNPRPSIEEIAPYYDFPEYYSHQDKSQSITQWIYQRVRNYNISKKVDLIEEFIEQGKILDYGCGTGEFLQEAKTNRWKVTGIEPNEIAREKANSKLEGKIYSSIEEIKKGSKYDVITLFHVLEHIHDLRKTVKSIINHLNKKGFLLIAVPNYESFDSTEYKDYWAGWDVPRHLYHFNKESMLNFTKEFRLNLIEIKPMIFDSFYVSLLSEKYKNPNSSIIHQYYKAFITGYKSNEKAKKPGDYSSNIYIFKKSENN